MGSTTPSRRSSRTRGVDECSSAVTVGIRKRIAPAHKTQRKKKDAANLDRSRQKERLPSNPSFIAHLRLISFRFLWNSASVRAVVWPLHSPAPASALSRLPPARDPAFSARGRFSPASFEPPRNHALRGKPAIPSPL